MIEEHTEQCDDGNTDDLDGCSSTCQLEQGFIWDNSSSKAMYNEPVNVTLKSIMKEKYKNLIEVQVSVETLNHEILSRIRWEKVVSFDQGGSYA